MKKEPTKKSKVQRETQEDKIRRIMTEVFNANPRTEISDCTLVGAKFDEPAIDAIQTIAEGLVKNAEALSQLAYVLKASNVNIETMIKVQG